MKKLGLMAAMAVVVTSSAYAAPTENSGTVVMGTEYHRLTDGQPNWHRNVMGGSLHWGSGLELAAEVFHTERYALRDYGFSVQAAYPLTDHQVLDVRYSGAQDIDFLPKHALELGYAVEFGNGLGFVASIEHEDFHLTESNRDRYSLGGSYAYSDRYKVEYTFQHARLNQGVLSGNHHDLQWHFQPSSDYQLTLGASAGEQVFQVTDTRFLVSDTRSVYMKGAFALSPEWRVFYGLAKYNHKDAFDRTEMSAGVEYRF